MSVGSSAVAMQADPMPPSATSQPDTKPLSRQRRFVTPRPDETIEELARRALPDDSADAAMDLIKSWNLHIFAMRKPAGLLLGSDVVFVEPPLR